MSQPVWSFDSYVLLNVIKLLDFSHRELLKIQDKVTIIDLYFYLFYTALNYIITNLKQYEIHKTYITAYFKAFTLRA